MAPYLKYFSIETKSVGNVLDRFRATLTVSIETDLGQKVEDFSHRNKNFKCLVPVINVF